MNKTQEKKKIWMDTYKIHSYEIDVKGYATLPILCQYMQESAWHHAENLGVGFSHLIKKHLIWVLANHLIKINSFPKWGDSIHIQTWPSGKGRLSYSRDFKIMNQFNKILGLVTTKWYAIDLQNRKPQNLDDYFDFQPIENEKVLSHDLDKIESINTSDGSKTFQVGYSDLDVNEHANNVKYIEWILESFSLEFQKSYSLKEIELNYIAEALYGDELSVLFKKVDDNVFIHNLIRQKDKTELCRAKTCWNKGKNY